MPDSPIIRPAVEADLPVILEIYNREILTGTVVYIDEPQTLEQRAQWFTARREAGMPVFVIEDADGVAGFGAYGAFRQFPGYQFCVEHSVYIAENKQRLGYGKRLLTRIIETATTNGLHTMVAAIDAENERSIKLHLDFDFIMVGHFPEVGCKFGKWRSVVFMQRTLDDRPVPPSPL